MRTTLDIDEDVLEAAKALARQSGRTAGQVISELARRTLTEPSGAHGRGFADEGARYEAHGWHVLPDRGGVVVTPEMVERIEEEADREEAGLPARRHDGR